MTIKGKFKVLCVLVIFITLCVTAESFAQTVTLRYGHTAGTILNYDLSLDTPGSQASQTVDLTVTRDVTSVDASEIMDITTSFSNGTMVINGISFPFPVSGPIMSVQMARDGQVQSTTALGQFSSLLTQAGIGSATDASADIFRALGILEFPAGAVQPGDSWTVNKSQSFPNGDTVDITYTYTLESYVLFKSLDCAQIKIEATPQLSIHQDFPELRRSMQYNGIVNVVGTLLFAHVPGKIMKLDETIESNAIGTMIGYDGMTSVVPAFQKTTVALEIQ